VRTLCLFAVSFAAAVFLAVLWLPWELLLPVGLACLAAGGVCLLVRVHTRGRRAVLIALGLCAGWLWTWGYQTIWYAPARSLDGWEGEISATALDWPEETSYGCSVLLELSAQGSPAVKALLYGTDPAYQNLKPGNCFTARARLRLSNTAYGEETDYYQAQGIFLLGSLADEPEILTDDEPGLWTKIRFAPAYFARALKDSATRCFGADAPLVIALITGDKSTLDGTFYSALQRTGLAHTVAVSGLHVGFLVGFAVSVLGRGRRRSAIAGIVLAGFFAAVTGGVPSVMRAVILQSFALIAPLAEREYDPFTGLSAALMLLLLCNPFAAASVSLQLSFASCAGIQLLSVPLSERLKTHRIQHRVPRRVARFCVGSLSTTLGALVFTVPITAYYFGQFSLIAPLSNLLVLWVMPWAFLGGLLTALIGLAAPGLGTFLAAAAGLPVRWLLWIIPALGKLPFASLPLDAPCVALWLAVCCVIVLLYRFVPDSRPKRPLIPLAACGIMLCAALLGTAAEDVNRLLTVHVLDVGQGSSTLIVSDGQMALVDCGGTGHSDPGDVAADLVQRMGCQTLPLVVLTHLHDDHTNGMRELLERLEVEVVLLPEESAGEDAGVREELYALAQARGTQLVTVTEDLSVWLGEAELTVCAPLSVGNPDANNAGLTVLCRAGEYAALITGDMDAKTEARLAAHMALPKVDLLVAGHHGSAGSTSQELLQTIQPAYAAISVGYNAYGHPSAAALERLNDAGCAVYRTDWMGTLKFTFSEMHP